MSLTSEKKSSILSEEDLELVDYLSSITKKVIALEDSSKELTGLVGNLDSDEQSFHNSVSTELSSLKTELARVDKEISSLIKNILVIISKFKNSLDYSRFSALKERVDSMNTEQFITREQFKAWLYEALKELKDREK